MNTCINKILLSFLILLSFSSLSGQDSANSSPYSCIYNHLYYLQDDSYDPMLSANSFSSSIDSSERKELAIQLKQIFDGKGLFIILEAIPNSPTYFDSLINEFSYSLFPKVLPEIYVVKDINGWHYSTETASATSKIHNSIYPFGTDLLLNLLPNKGTNKFLGLFVWQYLGIALLILFAAIFFVVLRFLFHFIYSGRRERNKKTWKQIKTLVAGWCTIKVFEMLLPILLLPINIMESVSVLLSIVMSILILIILLKLASIALSILDEITKRTESKMDDQLLPLLRRSIQFVIIALWTLHFLSLVGVNITTLIAGISIGGLAIALAAQDTLKNLFASITIFLDKPFQIGDSIKTGGVEGTVEEVGFRSTRIRSFTNSLIYVPNSQLSDSTVDNYGLRIYRRFKTTIGLTYDTPPDKIELFVKGLRQIVKEHPKTRKDGYEIHLNNLGDSALEILFYIFFEVKDWTEELESKHSMLISILKLAEELEVSFAFPSTSVYMEGDISLKNK